MDASGQMQLPGVETAASTRDGSILAAVAAAFDPARMTQARRLAGLTKKAVAEELNVSAVAGGQWKSGPHPPRADHVGRLAEVLNVPPAFLAGGRPYARLESSAAHFRSLRRTPVNQRAKAIAFAEQIGELVYALEKRVQLPPVDLPGFTAGEVCMGPQADPIEAARGLRRAWGSGNGTNTAHGSSAGSSRAHRHPGAVRRDRHGHRRCVLDLTAATPDRGSHS